MQDRFKFRIFDKKLNKMSNWGDNPYHNMEIVNMICSDNPDYNSNDNFHIMQCTGLKDKNGKLIYEGDIVYKKGNNFQGQKVLSEIVWSDMIASFLYSDLIGIGGAHEFRSGTAEKMEVVGNIYENPELLESEHA